MPYIGNTTSDFSIDTGNITNRAVTATKLSPSSVGSNGQVLSVDGSGNLQWSTDAALTLIDEDNMSSNSASSVPSQQSVKAYADTKAVLTGSTNNTITTVTGANALQGEANLTFDGNDLIQTVTVDGKGLTLTGGDLKPMIIGNANRSSANNTIFGISGKWNNTEVGRIAFEAGADTTNKDDGKINLYTRVSGGSLTSRLIIDSSGRILIGTTTEGSSGVDNLILYRNGNGGITIRNNANQNGNIFFSRGTSGTDEYKGYIQYQHAQDVMVFGTGHTERLRINSSGRVAIGNSTNNANPTALLGVIADDGEAANLYIAKFHNLEATTGQSFGVNIQAGSSADDHGLRVKNRANDSTHLIVRGDGNIGIGTASPVSKLHVAKDNSFAAKFGGSGGGSDYFIEIGQLGTNGSAGFNATGTSGSMLFKVAGTEYMRIAHTTGNVGIGTSSPSWDLDVHGSNTTIGIEGTGWAQLRLTGGGSENYITSDDKLSFYVGGNERIVFSTDGKVGIGTSAPGQLLEINGASNPCVLVKDTTNDCISYVYSQDSVATFGSASNHDVVFNVNNGEKARILTGGGITFNGDTAAANALDDYEEGTWTPGIGTTSGSSVTGEYRKIGNVVHIQMYVSIPSHSNSSTMSISGLPFSSIASRYASFTIGNFRFFNHDGGYTTLRVNQAGTTMTFRETGDSQSWQNAEWSQVQADFAMYVSGTYFTS